MCHTLSTKHLTFLDINMIKKLFTLFICMISLAMTFTSCSEEAFDTDSVNKQTILVFYPWTGSQSSTGLLGYLQNNIDSISDGIIDRKGLNNSRVLVFLSDKYNHSTLYDLQYNATTKSVDRVPLKEYEGASYASAEGIADIMNEVKTQASALNYALIVGVHGCGWTYASDWSRYPYYARPSVTRPRDNNFSGILFGPDPNAPPHPFLRQCEPGRKRPGYQHPRRRHQRERIEDAIHPLRRLLHEQYRNRLRVERCYQLHDSQRKRNHGSRTAISLDVELSELCYA